MGLFKKSYKCLRCGHIITKFTLRDRSMDICPKCGANIMNVDNIHDLRSGSEKGIEAEAYSGVSLGREADKLVAELIGIGRREDYIGTPSSGSYNVNGKHTRTREIGERLNQLGGQKLMLAAAYRVKADLGSIALSYLNSAWAWIGNWAP